MTYWDNYEKALDAILMQIRVLEHNRNVIEQHDLYTWTPEYVNYVRECLYNVEYKQAMINIMVGMTRSPEREHLDHLVDICFEHLHKIREIYIMYFKIHQNYDKVTERQNDMSVTNSNVNTKIVNPC